MFKDLKKVINEPHSVCGKSRPGSSDPKTVMCLLRLKETGTEKQMLGLERKWKLNNRGLCKAM